MPFTSAGLWVVPEAGRPRCGDLGECASRGGAAGTTRLGQRTRPGLDARHGGRCQHRAPQGLWERWGRGTWAPVPLRVGLAAATLDTRPRSPRPFLGPPPCPPRGPQPLCHLQHYP